VGCFEVSVSFVGRFSRSCLPCSRCFFGLTCSFGLSLSPSPLGFFFCLGSRLHPPSLSLVGAVSLPAPVPSLQRRLLSAWRPAFGLSCDRLLLRLRWQVFPLLLGEMPFGFLLSLLSSVLLGMPAAGFRSLPSSPPSSFYFPGAGWAPWSLAVAGCFGPLPGLLLLDVLQLVAAAPSRVGLLQTFLRGMCARGAPAFHACPLSFSRLALGALSVVCCPLR
jgi:hypothetical protein